MKHTIRLLFAALLVLVAACGDSSAEETTTTATAEPTTTAADTTPTTDTTAPPTTEEEATTTTASGSETEASGDLASLQAAMASSSEAAPSRIEGVIALSLPGGESAEMPMSVQVDPDTGDTAMTMDMGAMADVGGGEEIPPEMAELMGTMEMRQIGDTVYLKFPFFTAFLGAETEWVSMPAEEGDDVTDDMTSGAAPSDPSNFLESFSDVEGSVEELGTEEIRGFSTTHYRLVVNEDWQEHLSDEELAELEEQGPLPEASFPIELWVDGDGLVHRMSMEMTAEAMGETDDELESMTMTFDFFDFGESVTIEPPPADQVTDMSELSVRSAPSSPDHPPGVLAHHLRPIGRR
ncbi:MAG: hypothetical protein ACLFWM_12360 [Actinomycetota bacterium]